MMKGFARRYRDWLQSMGFVEGDPFAVYEAEREGPDLLPYCFIDRPYLHEVLGDPEWPQAAFLSAGRGAGKTATRMMVAYEASRGYFRGKVFVVDYTDFNSLLERVDGDLSHLTLRHHVEGVLRAALHDLADDFLLQERLASLPAVERSLLAAYIHAFADPHTSLRLGGLKDTSAPIDLALLSPLELLQGFAGLIARTGRAAVYILVDRVDETPQTAGNVEAAVALLRPLVVHQPLLEMPHLAFKFFISKEMGEALCASLPLRTDRMLMRTIHWGHEDLKAALRLRLQHFSGGQVEDMGQLCVSGIQSIVTDRLVSWVCDSPFPSPRTLLRLCGELLRHHVSVSEQLLIRGSEVSAVQAQFLSALQEEGRPLKREKAAILAPVPAAIPSEGIYLDDNDEVWVDGRRLEKPLSALEHRLFRALYVRAGQIVSVEELIASVWYPMSRLWTEEEQNNAADEVRLRKLVARLREALEPDPKQPRFVINVRGRGYRLDGIARALPSLK